MKGIQIERNFTQFVVFAEDTILSALSKITANQSRLIFVVTESGILQGVLTDGDFRRWIAGCGEIDLNRPVTAAMNSDCRSAPEGTSSKDLAALLTTRIIAVPLLDSHGRIVAVAKTANNGLQLGDRRIGSGEPCFVIAEIGNNHNGDLELAKQLVDFAKEANADCAKFQIRDLNSLYQHGDQRDFSCHATPGQNGLMVSVPIGGWFHLRKIKSSIIAAKNFSTEFCQRYVH